MKKRTGRMSLLVAFACAAALLPWMPRLLQPAYAGPQDDEIEFEEPESLLEILQEVKLARLEAQVDSLRLEIAERRLALVRELASVSEDKLASAAYGLMRVSDYMEDDDAADFLHSVEKETTDPAIKRLIRIRLTELEHEDEDLTTRQEHLRDLILSN
ncbi:MAG: hypothetical protein AAGG48_06205 [Planctomycetota bacterium]